MLAPWLFEKKNRAGVPRILLFKFFFMTKSFWSDGYLSGPRARARASMVYWSIFYNNQPYIVQAKIASPDWPANWHRTSAELRHEITWQLCNTSCSPVTNVMMRHSTQFATSYQVFGLTSQSINHHWGVSYIVKLTVWKIKCFDWIFITSRDWSESVLSGQAEEGGR